MNWDKYKSLLRPALDWIIKNQLNDGSIQWDEKGKCDPWDHCECLIALAIYEEWEAYDKGVEWFFKNLNDDGLIYSEYQNCKPSKFYFESHHAPYIIFPLKQASLLHKRKSKEFKEFEFKIDKIFNALNSFKDNDGYFYWAKNEKGYSDNSLITATMSNIMSEKLYKNNNSVNLDLSLWDQKFDRDGEDRSRFSMDFYYPYMAGVKKNQQVFKKNLEDFYVSGLGVKCVKEEPWITVAESSECLLAAIICGEHRVAKDIFKDILKYQNPDGIFPTGYQYELDILWPEENSTWSNAAIIIGAHALCNLNKTNENVFLLLRDLS
mgnify:FL=1